MLRKFWDQKCLHTEEASFHVVITSYQLVIADVKYFQRIKWQYMVLDEAQALKSSARYVTHKASGINYICEHYGSVASGGGGGEGTGL